MKTETKYKGSLKLAAIGDALGWLTEFEKNPTDLKSKYNTDYIAKFYNWEKIVGGKFYGYIDYIQEGSYSDDTQLMLSVARSITANGRVNREYFSKIELPNWLLYARGAGRTIKNAARKITRKSAKWNNNFFKFKIGKTTVDYRESGANGAAMRILPIALANFGNPKKINEEIFANSIITHGHPRAIIGAMLYGYAVDTILRFTPENFNYKTFLTELGKDIQSKLSIEFINKSEYASWVSEWDKNSKVQFLDLFTEIIIETQNYLRDIYKFIDKDATDFVSLSSIGCYNPKTKGSGTSTVIAGIYFTCKYLNNPLNGIEQAVNSIGTDTDSIAAFAGGLIGALHGKNIIPQKWNNIQDSSYIDKMAIQLLQISENEFKENNTVDFSNYRTLNNISSDNFSVKEIISFVPLGLGKISNIDKQETMTKGKYNLIIEVDFDIGQSCKFAQILSVDNMKNIPNIKESFNNFLDSFEIDSLVKDQIVSFESNLSDSNKSKFKQLLTSLLNPIT